MPPRRVPKEIRCASLVYDTKKKEERQCLNPIKIGSFCTVHWKARDPQGDPETEVGNESSFSQSVLVEDELITQLHDLTLNNEKNAVVESYHIPQQWTPEKVRSADGISNFGFLDTYRKGLEYYMPKNLDKYVYKDVFKYLMKNPKTDRPGHVYIFRCTPTWRVLEYQEMIIKIGRADSVEERKNTLENWCNYYTFEELEAFPDTEPPEKIKLSNKAEKLSHKSLDNRLYQATSSGKCLCQKAHKELFKILESELDLTIELVRHWVNVVQKHDKIWPGLSARHSMPSSLKSPNTDNKHQAE